MCPALRLPAHFLSNRLASREASALLCMPNCHPSQIATLEIISLNSERLKREAEGGKMTKERSEGTLALP